MKTSHAAGEATPDRTVTRRMRLGRARWRCRRGTKELDVLLERFAARALHRLDDAGLDALERLLGQPDQDLHIWLVSAPASPPPPEMRGIVALVRRQSKCPEHQDATT